MEIGEIIEEGDGKVKGRKKESKRKKSCAATLSDLYPLTCLTWEALTGV